MELYCLMKRENKFPIIYRNQYLSDILDHIYSHIIFFKVEPGIGATSMEIEDESRNSIIIEPNKPVIEGKCKKYNTKRPVRIMGVYEGKTVDQIIDYLESKVTPKKIITTPESYPKVKEAMDELQINVHADYFMLFDECERTIQDVSYRANILLPIDDFFQFEKKAFISATPIAPSDPRFEKQGFTNVYLNPEYDYKQDIKLIGTNNVFFTFKHWILNNPREQYFIFLNSTDTIAKLIDYMDIRDETSVFCAKESMQRLKVNNYTHVFTSLGNFRKYNFLTSRFFSAVDIDDIPSPTILMITDLVSAQHSMIDPKSEAIQIPGRFRSKRGTALAKEVVHITNLNPDLDSKSVAQVKEHLSVWRRIYSVLRRFLQAASTIGAKDVLKEVIKRLEFSKYVNSDGSTNYFMQDNMLHEEKVKGYYQSMVNLEKAYNHSGHFNTKVENESYEYSDADNAKLLKFPSLKTVFEVVMPIIQDLHEPEKYGIFHVYFQMDHLKQEFPEVVRAFNIIGLEKAKELNFNHRKIKNAIKLKELETEKTNFGLISYLERAFKEGDPYSSGDIYRLTKQGILENKLCLLTPGVKLLKQYCELSPRIWIRTGKDGKDVMGYKVIKINNKIKR